MQAKRLKTKWNLHAVDLCELAVLSFLCLQVGQLPICAYFQYFHIECWWSGTVTELWPHATALVRCSIACIEKTRFHECTLDLCRDWVLYSQVSISVLSCWEMYLVIQSEKPTHAPGSRKSCICLWWSIVLIG